MWWPFVWTCHFSLGLHTVWPDGCLVQMGAYFECWVSLTPCSLPRAHPTLATHPQQMHSPREKFPKSKQSCAGLWYVPCMQWKSATCLCQILVVHNQGVRGKKTIPPIPSAAAAMSWPGLIGTDVGFENWTWAKAGPSVAGGGTLVESPRTSENRRLDFYCVSGDLSVMV